MESFSALVLRTGLSTDAAMPIFCDTKEASHDTRYDVGEVSTLLAMPSFPSYKTSAGGHPTAYFLTNPRSGERRRC